MMKTKKMRKKEHAKHVQSQYNNLANIRRGEISCKFCNDALFHKHDYLKIHYTPMGNKR